MTILFNSFSVNQPSHATSRNPRPRGFLPLASLSFADGPGTWEGKNHGAAQLPLGEIWNLRPCTLNENLKFVWTQKLTIISSLFIAKFSICVLNDLRFARMRNELLGKKSKIPQVVRFSMAEWWQKVRTNQEKWRFCEANLLVTLGRTKILAAEQPQTPTPYWLQYFSLLDPLRYPQYHQIPISKHAPKSQPTNQSWQMKIEFHSANNKGAKPTWHHASTISELISLAVASDTSRWLEDFWFPSSRPQKAKGMTNYTFFSGEGVSLKGSFATLELSYSSLINSLYLLFLAYPSCLEWSMLSTLAL